MNIIKKLTLICTLLFISTTLCYAQNHPGKGTVGLSASLQNNQTNLRVPIWVSNDIVLAPSLGFASVENNFTTLNVGLGARFYQNQGDNFGTYLGARGQLQQTTPDVGSGDTDFLIGLLGGGEYFLGSHFSLGVEGQLNFLLNDNGNNQVSTGAAVVASYYF